ncbi:MAG: hypothetical protein LUH15_05955 [Tannerellaceae bacterium]|nr:hypothetical protein [Tannerellaceae bacterium]
MKRLSIILFFLLFALNGLISQNQQLALDISSLNELMLFRGKIETIKFNKRKKLVTLTLLVEETILGNNHQNGKTITIILNPIYATLIKDNPFVTYENISLLFMGILNRIPKDSVLVYCFNTTKYNYFIPVIEYLFLSFKLPGEEFQAFAKNTLSIFIHSIAM